MRSDGNKETILAYNGNFDIHILSFKCTPFLAMCVQCFIIFFREKFPLPYNFLLLFITNTKSHIIIICALVEYGDFGFSLECCLIVVFLQAP